MQNDEDYWRTTEKQQQEKNNRKTNKAFYNGASNLWITENSDFKKPYRKVLPGEDILRPSRQSKRDRPGRQVGNNKEK